MAKSGNQKLKILYLSDLLMRLSDEQHPISTQEMIDYLESLGISAERKSIYADMDALRQYGLDIIKLGGKNGGYYLASRPFEVPELKLLVDSVQSSRFITHKKSLSLIKKIEGLCSEHEAKALQGQVFVAKRIKTMNESIYYNVDTLHEAISRSKQITFQYYEYSLAKARVAKHGGETYHASPVSLTWDDENYYLIAYDAEKDLIKHYRVDKMGTICITDLPRHPKALMSGAESAEYANRIFGMFPGENENVRVRFASHLVGAVIDRFGTNISIIPDGDEHFLASLPVAVSPQFFAWIFGFGTDAVILSPVSVAEKMKNALAAAAEQYQQGGYYD